jgi:hypothetical protein
MPEGSRFANLGPKFDTEANAMILPGNTISFPHPRPEGKENLFECPFTDYFINGGIFFQIFPEFSKFPSEEHVDP